MLNTYVFPVDYDTYGSPVPSQFSDSLRDLWHWIKRFQIQSLHFRSVQKIILLLYILRTCVVSYQYKSDLKTVKYTDWYCKMHFCSVIIRKE